MKIGSPSIRQRVGRLGHRLSLLWAQARARLENSEVAIFHRFRLPPWGGGNQFLLALREEFERRGLRVGGNVITSDTRACLFNSFNFDFDRLRCMNREGRRMVHRVDGPIGVYRGRDDGSDRRIWEINNELADATVFQSSYSLQRHAGLGLSFQSPVVIMNAANARIFYPDPARTGLSGGKVKLISTSWSDNPNKGAATYKWLEGHLDWDRFEYTFVGHSQIRFERIRVLKPMSSRGLADLLRRSDIFITASLHDPCSNSLIEAVSCGLPAIYARSGGHAEIVKEAGLGFSAVEEIPQLLEQLVDEYAVRRARISVPSLAQVADQYLAVMGIRSEVRG